MVVLEQRLFGLFRYCKAFFPTLEEGQGLISRLRLNGIVRFHYPPAEVLENAHPVSSFPVATVCIDLTQGADNIFKRMNPTTCRTRIRAADRLADRISIVTNNQRAAEGLLDLYNTLARAKGRVPRLDASRLRRYLEISDVRVLYFEGRAMCSHLTLRDEARRRVILMFSANRRLESADEAPLCGVLNRYLHWQELRYYCDQGMEVYDFGGIGYHNPQGSAFNQFKLSFGGEIRTEHSYTFSGMPMIGRLAVEGYKKLRSSRASRLIGHL